MPDEARPYSKEAQLSRGPRRYRRKVASAKDWQKIQAEKLGPCRVCVLPATNGGNKASASLPIHLHHLVSRQDGGDDVADNIVPLCELCHDMVTRRGPFTCEILLANLTDAEYAYMVERGGEDYAERAYGIRYER